MNWLRENTKSIIIFTVAAFVATIFFQWGMNYMGGGQNRQRTIAHVNDEKITHNEFQQRVNQARERYRERNPGRISSSDMDEIRRNAFKQLVNQIILQDHLKQFGITASDAQVRAYIRQRYFTNQQGQIDQQRWQRFLQQASDRRKSRLEEAQRRQIETSRMQQWLSSHVSLPEAEFNQLLKSGIREANLYGIYLDPGEYISDDRIQDFYLANDERFQAPPRAYVRKIFFSASDTSTATNQQDQLQQLKGELKAVRRRYEAGESFSQLAREFSDDTSTRSNGGLIGWVTPSDFGQDKSQEIFQLEQGEMSNLVKTDNGYLLYYVEKGPIREKQPLPAVKPKIVRTLLSDSHWQSARQQANKLHEQITRSSEPFQQFQDMAVLHSHGKSASEGGHYGWVPSRFIVPSLHSNSDTELWQGEIANQYVINETVSSTVFSSSAGEISEPVRTEYGLHIFYPKEFRQPKLDTLTDTDANRIRRVLEREKQSNFLTQWLTQKRKQANIQLNVPEEQVGGKISGI